MTIAAALGVGALVRVGGGEAALPGMGLAWLAWRWEARRQRWIRSFKPRGDRWRAEALAATAYFGAIAAVGALAGGGCGCLWSATAFGALSVALEALEFDTPAALWGVATLAWVGPALPTMRRLYSVPAASVEEWLPVIVLTAIYLPLSAALLLRGGRS